ncbi:kinase-like domain-containing protein [Rhizophagus clarus]|uniref:Kinase-like domain-containing protein n=1 Tax=Rhizophagus clarus TaxID=94130 RepID=A0A8H3L289_9GLOM|nr:kinase-like domain-containing protein [Rhizophagus clarus]
MTTIRRDLVSATVNRVCFSTDFNIHTDTHKRYKFRKQTILADKLLTNDEKAEAIKYLDETYDRNKVLNNSGTKRICENCNKECLATLYCEYCVRNYLQENFKNWSSGNDDIDDLIQKCQMESLGPANIVEWIPYSNLDNVKYLTKGGFSDIYTANWINGYYREWDSKKQQLKRLGIHKVVLKKLENVESANKNWFEEAKSHLTISNKRASIARCFGLTQDILSGNYMIVMMKMDMDLRKYLQVNYNRLTWKEKFRIAYEIINALYFVHKEEAIHRDLHSGNILYSQFNDTCVAILMWEISSGYSPFINYECYDCDLVMIIIDGIRPEIVPGTPLEYKNLMEECWDADPSNRPDIKELDKRMEKIYLEYQSIPNELYQSKVKNNFEIKNKTNYTSSSLHKSKLYQFENLPEPKNATEVELEAFHSKSYDFINIPDDIDDYANSNNQKIDEISKISSIFKDDYDVYNNPNLHPEEQNELKIPDGLFLNIF